MSLPCGSNGLILLHYQDEKTMSSELDYAELVRTVLKKHGFAQSQLAPKGSSRGTEETEPSALGLRESIEDGTLVNNKPRTNPKSRIQPRAFTSGHHSFVDLAAFLGTFLTRDRQIPDPEPAKSPRNKPRQKSLTREKSMGHPTLET